MSWNVMPAMWMTTPSCMLVSSATNTGPSWSSTRPLECNARFYRRYADGAGLRYIAQQLTDDGVPSLSQYDPARNRHRDPRGWSHSAIRAMLDNPVYRGIRVWGKQKKYEVLLNTD